MKYFPCLLAVIALATVPLDQLAAADITWSGAVSSAWETGANWSNGTGPAAGDQVFIHSGTVNFTANTGSSPSMRGLRLLGGTLQVSGGTLSLASTSSAESHVDGAFVQTGGTTSINELEVGRTPERTGSVVVSGGSLSIARALSGYSLYLGANRSTDAGNGSFQISSGSFVTRSGVKLGDLTRAGTGTFSVLGSAATQIGIAAGNTDTDGTWKQHAGSTLRTGIDFRGVTPILIKDSPTATTGTSATFEAGSLLDVGYFNGGNGGGTWTVLEVENGPIINHGLAFVPGVNTSIWSFSIENSGPNSRLKVTAVGDPAGFALNVGATKKQKMRYGMDYERLWYWTSSTSMANKAKVAQWSTADCDIDFVRVAINSEYELEEGNFNLVAYTDKIIPMMQAMKTANPNIKFFASPRPLNEAVSNAAWQPFPLWITGAPSYTSTSFNFQWQKCAEYLVRYVSLMKSYGFKISFMDLTNEWNFVDSGDYRDIKAHLQANLAPEDMPLLVGPSAWNYAQGASWLSGATTSARKNAIDIASCHNTDKAGTAQDFANRVEQIWPGQGKEVWNTELHGWKSTSGADEVLSSAFLFEGIRAGFSGMSGWLAIGTTNQGHSYILNPSGTPSRNVKYFIFRKLTTTSNYGHALDIPQHPDLSAAPGSDEEDANTSTAALLRGNLMTVWVMNHADRANPVVITPTGRTLAESTIKRTRWNTALAVEGMSEFIPASANRSVWSGVPARSLVCHELLLDPIGPPYKKFEAENAAAKSGTTTETTGDAGSGLNVGNISNNTWLRFDNFAPGATGTIRFRVARPAGRPDGRIEIRQDSITGPVLGSVAVPETGGWQMWETIEAPLAPVSGLRSIFLKFVESGSSTGSAMFNLNWLSIIVPPLPSGLAAAPNAATQSTIQWNAAAGATSYELLRSTSGGGPYTSVATGLTVPTFTDTGLTAGTSYYYVVRAVYPEVISPDSAEVRTVPSAPIDPKDVVIASTVVVSDGAGGSRARLTIARSGVGHFYQAQSAPTLASGAWIGASGVVMGNGGQIYIDVPLAPGAPQHFYKVKVWRE